MSATMAGGRIRYVSVPDDDGYSRHRLMRRRAAGGGAAAPKRLPRAAITRTTRAPGRYRSSPIARRGFCAARDAPPTDEPDGGDRMGPTMGSFDDPGRMRPTSVTGIAGRHDAWIDTRDLATTRTDDNADITAKWIAACGQLSD